MAKLHGSDEHVAVERELHSILGRFMPEQWMCIVPGEFTVTSNGLCFVYFDDRFLQAGLGVRAGMTPSRGVLEAIAKINGDNPFVHAWLSPHLNRQEDLWTVMCGYKIYYHWLTVERLHNYIFQIMESQQYVVTEMTEMLAPFGGYPSWNPDGNFPDVISETERIRLSGVSLAALLKPVARAEVERATQF